MIRLKKDGDATVSPPTLFIGGHVAYQALPLDRELEPSWLIGGRRRVCGSNRPGCPGAAGSIAGSGAGQGLHYAPLPLLSHHGIYPLGPAACSDQVRVTVIDGELFVEAAQKDRVSAAPTVILDDRFRWTGSVDAGELVTLMLDSDPVDLGPDALRGMIEAGNAEGVAGMMAERGMIFPAFIELLIHPRWSVRLGAMVSFETLVESDPGLAGEVVETLVAVFSDVDDGVKGDLIHVMGESGNRAALPFLGTVASGDYDDEVQAAAEEAIEKLE